LSTQKQVYVVIHGHFYQPPRENPWTAVTERQPAAYPFHDWNERIASECYTPNTVSRLLDSRGKIDDIVNNFEYISFNIGPTLFRWLQMYERKTYELILSADELSRRMNDGHGNAIAQPYNHMIMPLAHPRDQATQIRWGMDDFRARFAREPEGMWLPETAINDRTALLLTEAGIRFTILSPSQVKAVRPIGSRNWNDVSDDSIDTTRPYRLCIRDESGNVIPDRHLVLFFFNKKLSTEISFEHLLRNADDFAARICAEVKNSSGPLLINAAADGETFGHHEPFADMCLAYFFEKLADKHGLTVTNYARYLEMFEPVHEVLLKEGPHGKGTSWSCPHGVARWEKDCTCSTGSRPGWNQKWRTPLRSALNLLKQSTDAVYESEAGKFLKDPWKARDDYYPVIAGGAPERLNAFLKEHAAGNLSDSQKTRVLRLLEAALNSMLMFTSCGWFFADISGIETVQNMKYAAKVFDLLEDLLPPDLYGNFTKELSAARSNIPEYSDGKYIYENLAAASAVTPDRVAASYAFAKLLTGKRFDRALPLFRIEEIKSDTLPDRYSSLCGELEIENREILETSRFIYLITKISMRDVRCYVKESSGSEYENIIHLLQNSERARPADIFKGRYHGWSALTLTVSEKIVNNLMNEELEELNRRFIAMYEKNREFFEIYRETAVGLPAELRLIIHSSLSHLLYKEFLKVRGSWQVQSFQRALAYLEEAARYQVRLDTSEIRNLLEEDLAAEAHRFQNDLNEPSLQNIISIFEIGRILNIKLRKDTVENIVLLALEEKVLPMILQLADPRKDLETYARIDRILDMAERINISRARFDVILKDFKARL